MNENKYCLKKKDEEDDGDITQQHQVNHANKSLWRKYQVMNGKTDDSAYHEPPCCDVVTGTSITVFYWPIQSSS